MKLTRSQLIHARDVQLAAVGITRSKNRGWLKAALLREFTDREVARFTFATRETKRVGKFIISTDPENKALVLTLDKSALNVPQQPPQVGEMQSWLITKIANAEQTVKAREQMASTWRSGTDESWVIAAEMHPSTAGKSMKRVARMKAAQAEDRIVEKCRHELAMFKAVYAALERVPRTVATADTSPEAKANQIYLASNRDLS